MQILDSQIDGGVPCLFQFPIGLRLAGTVPGQKFGTHFQFDRGAQEFAGVAAFVSVRREAPQIGGKLQ